MIKTKAELFTENLIDDIAIRYNKTDKSLIQKQVFALALLFNLRDSELDFIFKGGTSLLFLLKEPLRFSIDIDIIVQPGTEIESYLNKVVSSGVFTGYDEVIRASARNIPKRHFRFYFKPRIKTAFDSDYILLDVLFQTNEYPDLCNVKSTPLLPSFQVDSRDIIVPTTESILGDKITTLAPNTIGIPYFKGDKNRGLEIAKQIYDTGNLFDETVDFEKVKQSFINTALKEIDYHGCTAGLESVIEDCFLFSRMICIRDQSDPGFSIVQKGISRLAGFLLNRRFYIEEVIISLSKAAIILAGIKSGYMEIKKYNELESINDFTIKNPDFSKLNKLKKILPEAFYYWHKALQLKGIE